MLDGGSYDTVGIAEAVTAQCCSTRWRTRASGHLQARQRTDAFEDGGLPAGAWLIMLSPRSTATIWLFVIESAPEVCGVPASGFVSLS
jgi:hypothetical protein